MNTKAVQVGIGSIALFMLLAWVGGRLALGPTLALASMPSIEGSQAQSAPEVPACDPNWDLVSSPNVSANYNFLNGVGAVSSTNVWAAGYYVNGSNVDQTLVEQWTGSHWSVVSSPNMGTGNNVFSGVAAISSTDVWAVGYYVNASGVWQTLVEHWNGSQWSVVSSPNVGTARNVLNGVAAVSSTNVWVVGYYYNGTANQTLVEHWNGSQWVVVFSPNAGTSLNELNGVAAVSSTDMWAVGYYGNSVSGVAETLVEHWDGSAWSVVSSPNVGIGNDVFLGVSAISSTGVWAVGYYENGSGVYQTLVEQWYASQWVVVSSPNVGTRDNFLSGVSAASATNVWAVGSYDSGSDVNQTLVEQWDGTQWNVVSPNAVTSYNQLNGIAAVSSTDVWAVGVYYNGYNAQTLVEQWSGSQWNVVASPNAGTTYTSYLYGMAVVSSTDVWAVGNYASGTGVLQTLVEQWDGSAWSIGISPNAGTTYNNYLTAVGAVSSTDVWAVGYYYNGSNVAQTLVEHWNGGQWNVVPSPNVGISHNYLTAVGAVSSTGVWAVGYYINGAVTQTLVEHWDGSAWSVVSSPNMGSETILYGVAAISSTDVWAVGEYINGSVHQTLVEHWNGSAWSVVASPNGNTTNDNYLNGVAAISAGNVWAAGYYVNGSGVYQTLVEHWNGSAWSVVPSPNGNTSYDNYLSGVSAASATNVWAVGYYYNSTVYQTLVEHWDGSAWSVVPSPNAGTSYDNRLTGVGAVSSTDVWAVGSYFNFSQQQTLVERYNPCSSTATPTRSPTITPTRSPTGTPTRTSTPNAPSATPTRTHTVVAPTTTRTNTPTTTRTNTPTNTVMVPTNTRTSTPTNTAVVPTNTPTNTSTGTVMVPTNTQTNTPTTTAMVPTNTPVHTATLTNTPAPLPSSTSQVAPTFTYTPAPPSTPTASPTNTYTPTAQTPTIAPTITPVSCTLQFSDVPVGSTFYPYVHCLACMGIINGFTSGCPSPDPCFKPSNPVTRGQLAKIVSNSAGYNDQHTERAFQDVAVGSTFYDFVERLASRSIIGGYTCGRPGEPCVPPDNLPYFRPYAQVTRGQISKIVAIAALLPAPPAGQQTFEDVPPTSTFWEWIEELASGGAIGGYACGGAGEPCVPPQNRAYFRPGNNVTRGQASKIVSNTFFPDCAAQAPYRR